MVHQHLTTSVKQEGFKATEYLIILLELYVGIKVSILKAIKIAYVYWNAQQILVQDPVLIALPGTSITEQSNCKFTFSESLYGQRAEGSSETILH